MYTSFASGTLIVLGVLLTLLGLFGGAVQFVFVGLAAITVAGILGLFERRMA